MFMNFSIPMSAPKPLSVTTQSASLSPTKSAMIELFPWAMLANGPACTKTGVFSVVWSSVGLMASRSSTAIAPAVLRASALTVCPWSSRPITIRPSRWRRSLRLVVRPRMAITSEATAMSKPDSRGWPFSRPPRPITIFRSARSLTSTTRGQVMVSGSMRSLLPWVMELSTMAASRLWASEIAWTSPVRWRLKSSMGTTCAWPPPAAPPLIPNIGPSDGWRIAAMVRQPIRFSAIESPMVVVVLPSPSGVGVIAVTSMYFPSGRPASRFITGSVTFALCLPYSSSSSSSRPRPAAISAMGLSRAR